MNDCDILIITWNGLDYTKKCVESVQKNTKNLKFRFIFVDNNSTDGTLEYLKEIPNAEVITNSENLGFVKAMNLGFDKVSSKYTVWLNNDTIVTPNWLDNLIQHLKNNPKAAAIGPVSNGTGVIQKEPSWSGETSIEDIASFGQAFHNKNKGKVTQYHRIAGFCIVMKSDLISKIGKLDEQLNLGGYEDDDYCKRIRDSGYQILIAEDVFIYHKSGVSFSKSKSPDSNLAFLMQQGRRRLLRKWIPAENHKKLENEPLVSVIMATKDREKIIPNAIESVLEQTYKNWELLIVNDGGEKLEEIKNRFSDSRIKYFDLEEHKGKSHANNVAIEKSSGQIIAYLDDDDRWHSNHLEVSIKELTRLESRLLVYSDYVQVDCIINQSGIQSPSRKQIKSLKDARCNPVEDVNFIPNLSIVHKKTLFYLVGKYDEGLDYYEDWDMLKRFSKVAYFVHIPEVTGEYWINQLQSARNARALRDRHFEGITNYIKNKNDEVSHQILIDLDIADSLVKKNELDRAFNIYKKILEKDPDFSPAIIGCADRLFNLKKYEEANEYLKKLYTINPFDSNNFLLAAHSLINIKEYEKAKTLLEYALLIRDDKNIYYLLHKCYKNLGNKSTEELIRRKMSFTSENINLQEVEEFLINLYNKSAFNRKLLVFGYKFLKKISRK